MLYIMSIDGRIIHHVKLNDDFFDIGLTNVRSGLCFLTVLDEEGRKESHRFFKN